MIPTNYFKVCARHSTPAIVAFEEASRRDIRLAFDMARSLARGGGRLSVCYAVPVPGKWAKVPAILERAETPFVRERLPTSEAVDSYAESWCE